MSDEDTLMAHDDVMPQGGGLADAIRRRLGECSPAERKVGRVLLAAYPSAGFETVAVLAARAGVSGPSVLRFVTRLGFSGFGDFQRALREDLDDRSASPLSMYDASGVADHGDEGAPETLVRSTTITLDTVRRTFESLPPHDFARAVELLCGARRVFLLGGRFSHLLARFLGQHLQQMRPGVEIVSDRPEWRAAAFSELGRSDLVVVFDYRRYEQPSFDLARRAVDRHASVLLFTDVWLSPVASIAGAVLPTHTGAPSPYDAMTPALAVVEAIIAAVLAELGEPARQRMTRIEAVGQDLSLF